MSRILIESINCPNCEAELKVNIYHSINANLEPELKEKLINGALTEIKCNCGQEFVLRYPMLFHVMGLNESIMILYTQKNVEETKRKYEEIMQFMKNVSVNKKEVKETIEVYSDWDEFIGRMKEIN